MPPKRKRSDEGHIVEDNDDSSNRYAYLKPHVRRVSEKTIKSKWTTLPESVQDKVRDMFHVLEHPVIGHHRNEQKRIEAQSTVQAVVRNLERRLPRMPFPPMTKESNFDFELALNEHRLLEVNLATINDSIELLKSEVAKEETLLTSEKKALQEMDKNAKRAEAERKRQLKNEHPLLRQLDGLVPTDDTMGIDFNVSTLRSSPITLDELDADSEIQELMKQLHGHLQSMRTNTGPFSGLRDAIARSQVALDLYLGSND